MSCLLGENKVEVEKIIGIKLDKYQLWLSKHEYDKIHMQNILSILECVYHVIILILRNTRRIHIKFIVRSMYLTSPCSEVMPDRLSGRTRQWRSWRSRRSRRSEGGRVVVEAELAALGEHCLRPNKAIFQVIIRAKPHEC